MNLEQIVRRVQRLPLPQGKPVSYLWDCTDSHVQRALHEPPGGSLRSYSVAGVRLRMAMDRHRNDTYKVARRLADFVRRLGKSDMADEQGLPRDWRLTDISDHVLLRAVFEEGSPFVMGTIWPSGLIRISGGSVPDGEMELRHPDAPASSGSRG